MGRGVQFAVLILVVTALVATPLVSAQTTQEAPDADNTITLIQVSENGTAQWTIQVRTRLETDEEVEQFEAYQERLRSADSSVLEEFRTRMTGVVRNAANQTSREMVARDFGISTHIQEVPRRWGVVSYEFSWVGFAVQREDRLFVGDVFQGGFFLAEDDRLVIAAPPASEIVDSAPAPDSTPAGAVAWAGRRDFADERPMVEFAPNTSGPGGTVETTDAAIVATDTPGAGDGLLATISELRLPLLVIAAAVLGYLLWRRRGGTGRNSDGSGGSNAGQGAGPFMTNEERIRAMLEENDGQVRQADVAERMDWSASKTSRVLSEMAGSGEIEKLQIGRENIIRLPEESQPVDEQ